jgi:hypothetical protein
LSWSGGLGMITSWRHPPPANGNTLSYLPGQALSPYVIRPQMRLMLSACRRLGMLRPKLVALRAAARKHLSVSNLERRAR